MTKTCGRCKETKDLDQFSLCRKNNDGRQGYCKPCQLDYQRGLPPDVRRATQRRHTYGITSAEFRALERAQHRSCQICKIPFGMLDPWDIHVDHNADTGAVRGLLCLQCNKGIGMFYHDARSLESAARYLRVAEKG